MENVCVILDDRRCESITPSKEKRNAGYLIKGDIDVHLEHLKWEYDNAKNYIKDKEKKKLMMMAGSFTVLSILVSILGLSSKNAAITSEAIFTVIIFGTSILNISIIKHVIGFKAEIVRATRHVNCIRQAIAAMIYTKIQGKYPTDKDLTEKSTAYWEMVGRHNKFPIDNIEYRKKYESKSIKWESADFLTVYMIATFTSILALYPILTIIFGFITDGSDPKFSAALGAIGGVTAIMIIWMSSYLVKNEIPLVLEEMNRDCAE